MFIMISISEQTPEKKEAQEQQADNDFGQATEIAIQQLLGLSTA